MSPATAPTNPFIHTFRQALGHTTTDSLTFQDTGTAPSVFAVSDLAAASMAAAACEVAALIHAATGKQPPVAVDTRLASHWFATSVAPQGWQLPPAWDALACYYRTHDGWIKLHTNAPHHRAAALSVLGVPADKARVTDAVLQ